MPFIWIPVVLVATVCQVTRNAFQRQLMGAGGPWATTLVRFLFGLPFSLVFVSVAWMLTPGAHLHFTRAFWTGEVAGGLCQVLATACLMVSMRRAGFAVGTALQQSSLPFAAILGWLFIGDALGPIAWAGVTVTSLGLATLSWPRTAVGDQPVSGAAFGLLSGALFSVGLVGFRAAGLALEPQHPIFSAIAAVTIVQALQSAGLIAYLLVRDPRALKLVVTSWRPSLGAGIFGALASAGWFVALALAPAAAVRAVGVVESPIAAATARRLFAERLHPVQLLAGLAVAVGVVMTVLR